MNINGEQVIVQLQRRELLRVAFRERLGIHCLEGMFWITQDGSRADVVIEAGQGIDLARPGAAVLQALVGGRLRLLELRPGRSPLVAGLPSTGR